MTDDKLLKRPIIILGAPRSGTTILTQMLSQHPDLATLIEPRLTWRYGNDSKSDMFSAHDARPEVIAYIRKSFANRIREAGRSRLLEKTPSNSLRPAFVDQIFPDAIFIHVIRNGYDACLATEDFWHKHASGMRQVAKGRLRQRLKELGPRRIHKYALEFARRAAPPAVRRLLGPNLWGPRLPGMPQMLRELGPMAVSCLQWRICVETSCHFGRSLPADRYFELRLEDFSAEVAKQLLDFCGLSPNAEVDNFITSNFDSTRARARSDIATAQQLDQVAPWLEATMAWLGYSDNQRRKPLSCSEQGA